MAPRNCSPEVFLIGHNYVNTVNLSGNNLLTLL